MSGNNNEKIFRLLGWEPVEHALYGVIGWTTPEGKEVENTPFATGDWEVCRERIIPAMREKGYDYFVSGRHPLESKDGFIPQQLTWTIPIPGKPESEDWVETEVKADNLPAALVAGAIEVLEKEKKSGIRRSRVSKVDP